jgi:hypothetical protein
VREINQNQVQNLFSVASPHSVGNRQLLSFDALGVSKFKPTHDKGTLSSGPVRYEKTYKCRPDISEGTRNGDLIRSGASVWLDNVESV